MALQMANYNMSVPGLKEPLLSRCETLIESNDLEVNTESYFTAITSGPLFDATTPNSTTMTQSDLSYAPLVSPEQLSYIETYLGVWVCLVMSLVGVATNVTNLCVFCKHGFTDSITISLTFIVGCEFIRCSCGCLSRLHGVVRIFNEAVGISWQNITFYTFTAAQFYVSNASNVMAAYVATERCFCVGLPLHVKRLITCKLTASVMAVVALVVLATHWHTFFSFKVIWVPSASLNTTVAKCVYTEFYTENFNAVMTYNNIVSFMWPVSSFATLVTCTVLIAHFLNKSAAFRIRRHVRKSANQKSEDGCSVLPKERKVMRMLQVVIGVYLINIFPRLLIFLARSIEYEFFTFRRYHNIYMACAHIVYVLDFTNASSNFFIFVSMNAKFKATFQRMVQLSPMTSRKDSEMVKFL